MPRSWRRDNDSHRSSVFRPGRLAPTRATDDKSSSQDRARVEGVFRLFQNERSVPEVEHRQAPTASSESTLELTERDMVLRIYSSSSLQQLNNVYLPLHLEPVLIALPTV